MSMFKFPCYMDRQAQSISLLRRSPEETYTYKRREGAASRHRDVERVYATSLTGFSWRHSLRGMPNMM